jgi:GntR family transcriptional regulator
VTGSVDPTSDRPVFRQIADLLREDIQTGRLAEGARLPSERDLMETYVAARGTVRQAVALLKAEGLIHTEHGRGGFVRSRPPVRRIAHDRFARRHREEGKAAFLAEAEAEGISPGVEVLKVGPELPPAAIAERLGIPATEKVLVRRRRYLADGDPVEMATSYLPLAITQGTAIAKKNPGPGGIYARLEEAGHRLVRFTEDVSARMPGPDEVRSLRLSAGTPVFGLVRTAYDDSGRAVEVCDTVMAADRFVLSYELPAG